MLTSPFGGPHRAAYDASPRHLRPKMFTRATSHRVSRWGE